MLRCDFVTSIIMRSIILNFSSVFKVNISPVLFYFFQVDIYHLQDDIILKHWIKEHGLHDGLLCKFLANGIDCLGKVASLKDKEITELQIEQKGMRQRLERSGIYRSVDDTTERGG